MLRIAEQIYSSIVEVISPVRPMNDGYGDIKRDVFKWHLVICVAIWCSRKCK